MKMQQILVILLLMPSIVFALDDKTAKANVAKELSVCAAYFFIGAEASKNSGDAELVKSIQTTADAALVTAINLSDKKTATATLETAMKDHQRLINNDVANIGILVRKYKTLCKGIMSGPKNRYDYWLKQK